MPRLRKYTRPHWSLAIVATLSILLALILIKTFDITADAFLQKQGCNSTWRLDGLLVGSSIIAFAKTLTLDHKLADYKHVPKHQQMKGSTNQLVYPRDKQSRDLPGLAVTSMLECQYLQTSTSDIFFCSTNRRYGQNKSGRHILNTL